MFRSNAKSRSIHPARMGTRKSKYWSDLTREHGYEPLAIEGEIPEDLAGTLYRTGPALTQRFGRPYGHVFEGDGAICATRLAGGRAAGAVRLVRGDAFLAEERAGKALHYSAASWSRQVANNFLGRGKNTGNTNILEWHGSLYALMENAKPIGFDRELNTIGESTLGGVVKSTFSAHPHDVVSRRTTYNFGMRFGKKTALCIYSLPWEGEARQIAELPLRKPVMLHDFMATDQHLVFLVSPVNLVLHRAIFALGSLSDIFRWAPEDGTEVIVVPIDEPTQVRRFTVDAFFQIHLAGGFEEPDATVVDIMAYKDSSALQLNVADVDKTPEAGVLTRIRIPRNGDRIEKERIADTTLEFGKLDPRVEGGPYRHIYGLTVDDTLFGQVHIDLEKGEEQCFWFPDGEFAGEGLFVPKHPGAAEGEGYFLSLVYSAERHTTYLAILDAEHIEDGPIAKAHFDHHIPAGFHGVWMNESANPKLPQW